MKISTRRLVQVGFVALTIIGVFVVQGNAEKWCPFGGVEAAYNYFTEGNLLCSLGISNFYILGAVLLMAVLARRAFCGYACPIGAMSEWLRSLGQKLRLPNLTPSYTLDRWLSPLKYVVLGIILYITWPAAELHFRAFDPCYALLSRHGEDITFWAYVVGGGIVALSLLMMVPFCRYLCPLAAVLNPFSRVAGTRIWRNENVCTNCGICTRACPMGIQVDKLPSVNKSHCTSCMTCINSCALSKRGAISWGPTRSTRWSHPTAIVSMIVIGLVGVAVGTAALLPLPSYVKTWGTPPSKTAVLEADLAELSCRGRATLLVYYLERDDELALLDRDADHEIVADTYLRLEAYPGPGEVPIRVIYDPAKHTEEDIKLAITQPYYDITNDRWRSSPFQIVGYDPLGLGDLGDIDIGEIELPPH